ncbi:Transmembrane protein 9 [Echinococcus granulosus]|uniref:TMEM9 n=1 Tax=Echinococcus granulosus TaxID=6210 RepID=U6JKL3_ECHGR|nr:Transmembrane protein 9 [Echinococcus granulosus]EUB55867.1 Transmembrane protein 9 [Echinococcus granulosus]CDS23865.1 TMEM9 [Echinococcus granulosus]
MLQRCLWVLVPLTFAICVEAIYEDARCKCVCVDHSVPKISNESSAEPKRSVYVKSISSDKCTCPIMLENKSDLCPYCDCKYQVRNTTTIKVVVIMIVVMLSTLSIYLVFMLILEPFLASRGRKNLLDSAQSNLFVPPKTIRTFRSYVIPSQRNNDYDDLTATEASGEEASGSRSTVGRRGVSTVVGRAREHQSRWKGRIEAQRDRVFNERTILN